MSIPARLCSAQFVSGQKSNGPLSPDYVPSFFSHTKSNDRRKILIDMNRFERVPEAEKIRLENSEKMMAAKVMLGLADSGNGIHYCEPYSGTCTCTWSMTEVTINDLNVMEEENKKLTAECIQFKAINS